MADPSTAVVTIHCLSQCPEARPGRSRMLGEQRARDVSFLVCLETHVIWYPVRYLARKGTP